jgi:hypothetical protein
MAKSTGLGASVAVDDSGGTPRTISNDITDFTINTPRPDQDVTGIDKLARERLLLLADFTISLNGVFNPAATTTAHAVFSTVPSSSVNRTTTVTVQAKILAGELLYTDYALTRGADGAMTWTAPGALADGAVPTWA